MSKQKKEDKKPKLSDKLLYKKTLVWEKEDHEQIQKFSNEYKDFLNKCKTERETVDYMIEYAKKKGFVNIENEEEAKKEGNFKFYRSFKNKNIALAVLGKEFNLKDGYNIIGSHIDNPRLDLKPATIFEDSSSGTCLVKTQYYGGIRKYQWVSIPLAMHGICHYKNEEGKMEEKRFSIGEKEDEPVFTIGDLLPHLARLHRSKNLKEAHPAEKLNIIVGTIPLKDEKSNPIKLAVLKHMKETLKIIKCEDDLHFAEIEIVPAGNARDIGFDKSLIGSYGHDDKVCAYSNFRALIDMKERPKRTSISLMCDKEEIGSDGSTGAKGIFLKDFVGDVLDIQMKNASERNLRKLLMNSRFVSADVTNAVNPNFKEVCEMMNSCKMGYGVAVSKYTGSGGKYSTNDANAEFMRDLRQALDKEKCIYQHGLLGKIDLGGGGTIAKFFAQYGCEVVDIGVGVVGMHSTFEIISKADLFSAFKVYGALFRM